MNTTVLPVVPIGTYPKPIVWLLRTKLGKFIDHYPPLLAPPSQEEYDHFSNKTWQVVPAYLEPQAMPFTMFSRLQTVRNLARDAVDSANPDKTSESLAQLIDALDAVLLAPFYHHFLPVPVADGALPPKNAPCMFYTLPTGWIIGARIDGQWYSGGNSFDPTKVTHYCQLPPDPDDCVYPAPVAVAQEWSANNE